MISAYEFLEFVLPPVMAVINYNLWFESVNHSRFGKYSYWRAQNFMPTDGQNQSSRSSLADGLKRFQARESEFHKLPI
jgi:hypothetical protein